MVIIAALQLEENSDPKNASKALDQNLNRSQMVNPSDFHTAAPTGEIQRIRR